MHTSWLTPNRAVRRCARPVRAPGAVRSRQQRGSSARSSRSRLASHRSACQLAGADDAETRLARCSGHLPGNRAVGFEPRRSGQSASCRLRASDAGSLDDVDALLAQEPRDRAAVVSQWLHGGRTAASSCSSLPLACVSGKISARVPWRQLSAARHGDHRAGAVVAFARTATRRTATLTLSFSRHPGCAMR